MKKISLLVIEIVPQDCASKTIFEASVKKISYKLIKDNYKNFQENVIKIPRYFEGKIYMKSKRDLDALLSIDFTCEMSIYVSVEKEVDPYIFRQLSLIDIEKENIVLFRAHTKQRV